MTTTPHEVQAHGTVRVTLPASVAYSPDLLKKSIGALLGRLGCTHCFSGANCLFQVERDFVMDTKASALERVALNPQPLPPGERSSVHVALASGARSNIDKVFKAVDAGLPLWDRVRATRGLTSCIRTNSGPSSSTRNWRRCSLAASAGSSLPELGVGVVYTADLEPLLDQSPDLVDVLEIEPQTLWLEHPTRPDEIIVRPEVNEHLATLPGRKLVHSIGTPVGGSVQGLEVQLPHLREAVTRLGAPWASEHLSFNLTEDHFTGFFLPPRQTEEGLEIYTQAIRRLQQELNVPFLFETGVNYLRPRHDEIPDGQFVAELASAADCGILLDLHNSTRTNGTTPERESVPVADSGPRVGDTSCRRVRDVRLLAGRALGSDSAAAVRAREGNHSGAAESASDRV